MYRRPEKRNGGDRNDRAYHLRSWRLCSRDVQLLEAVNWECEHLVCISFQEGTSFEDLCDTVNKEVERFIDGNVIILTDLPGGSPFKAAAMATFQYGYARAVTGTNFPLLLDLVLSRDYAEDVDQLLDQSIDNAREALMKMSLEQ